MSKSFFFFSFFWEWERGGRFEPVTLGLKSKWDRGGFHKMNKSLSDNKL